MNSGERLRLAVRAIALAAASSGLIAACDPVDGAEPYALWDVCEHPDGAFHFHVLEPPWERAHGFSKAAPVLLLDPSEDPGETPDPGARARLDAWVSGADSVADEAEARSAYWEGEGFAVEAAETYENRAGDLGIVQRASRGKSRVAELIFEGSSVVVISLWGRGSIGGEDFRFLLDGFEPRASGTH